MQIEKLLYNIETQQNPTTRQIYIKSLNQQSLKQVQNQTIARVNNFNPDDAQTIEQIRSALKLNIQLMPNNIFKNMHINDESFICSLAFYLNAETQTKQLEAAILFVQHQYQTLGQKNYAQSINLFKALLEVYQSINEQFYEKITLLMLKMVVQNLELLTVINHKYYFLQCLIQIVNQQINTETLCEFFSQIRKLYSSKKAQLFHSIDFQILVDILLRTLINENQSYIIEQALKLYLILSENPIISKDRYRVQQFHQAIKEKMNFISEDALDKSLKNIIQELLNFQ